jgi:hypothetical protein
VSSEASVPPIVFGPRPLADAAQLEGWKERIGRAPRRREAGYGLMPAAPIAPEQRREVDRAGSSHSPLSLGPIAADAVDHELLRVAGRARLAGELVDAEH